MTDETTRPVDEAAQAAEDAAKNAADAGASFTTQLINELNQLGSKVASAVQTAWDSEERQKAEDEIRKALHTAGDRIDTVAEDLRTSTVGKDVRSQATRAAEVVQKNDLTKQMRQGLLSGLRRLNEELTEFLDKNKPEDLARSAGEKAADAGKAAANAGEAAADAAATAIKEVTDTIKQA